MVAGRAGLDITFMLMGLVLSMPKILVNQTFSKKDLFFGQKISKILCLVFDSICIYYILSDYKNTILHKCKLNLCTCAYFIPKR